LKFSPEDRTFKGNPDSLKTVKIKVKARDLEGKEAED
jgi:hypothetical protein